MTGILVSRGPGLGVRSETPLEVCCPNCGALSRHDLAGYKDGAKLVVYVVDASIRSDHTPEEVNRITRPQRLTPAQTGVALPQKPGKGVKLPADPIPF